MCGDQQDSVQCGGGGGGGGGVSGGVRAQGEAGAGGEHGGGVQEGVRQADGDGVSASVSVQCRIISHCATLQGGWSGDLLQCSQSATQTSDCGDYITRTSSEMSNQVREKFSFSVRPVSAFKPS